MLHATTFSHTLQFKFEAGTSRGVLTTHHAHYLRIQGGAAAGLGEASPLRGLSPEYAENFGEAVAQCCQWFNHQGFASPAEALAQRAQWPQAPSLRFALETALHDLANGGQKIIFDNFFVRREGKLPINGLIWMGDEAFMLRQIEEKLASGFTCLKLKIGAIDFERELALLHHVRQRFSPQQITLRVDANGAFAPADALDKLNALARYGLHSIEQPIAPGQWAHMANLCARSPLPIALDEELIGQGMAKSQVLQAIRPQYLILKPTLLGGFAECAEWITQANVQGIDWWLTSALESNIGLNAVCQFAAQYRPTLPQGLGTGQLYHNNWPAPLQVASGFIGYGANPWGEV